MAVKEITDRISDYQFDLITAKFKRNLPKFERIGKVNVYRLGVGVPLLDKLLLPFWGVLFARRLNRRNHYDLFWCLMVTFASGAAYLFNLINFRRPTPIILTLQEGDSEEHFKKRWVGLINLSWRLALKKTETLTVISSYLGARAKKFGYKGEIKIIPNGVDLKKFKMESSKFKVEELKKNLKLAEDDKIIITVSRLVKKNGVGDLIEAMRYLPVNVKLLIIGGGELETDLKLKISNLKLADRVIMLGVINNEAVSEYLAVADIFVRPSLSEGLGISFLEAMAAGVPVIATPVGGIVDFLADGETGLFCEVRNPKSITEKVKLYLGNKELTEKIKINARELVIKNYNWDLIAARMEIIFEKITA